MLSALTLSRILFTTRCLQRILRKKMFRPLPGSMLSYYINDMIHLLKWQLFVLLFILLQMARVLLCSISALSLTACYKEYGVSSETENVVNLKP